MASTIRVPAPLKEEAQAYATGLGISLNALVSVALRDYLDARGRTVKAERAVGAESQQSHGGVRHLASDASERTRATGAAQVPAPARVSVPSVRMAPAVGLPKIGANQPCPCGSGQKYKRCHGRA
jgi:preprotein translocase subunit SecA